MPTRIGDISLHDIGTFRSSRSVSWNSSGSLLAAASTSDRVAKIYTSDGSRELFNLGGHNGPVDKVRFHPDISLLLLTNSEDKTLRLWDVRALNVNPNLRPVARLDLNTACISMAWAPSHQHNLVVCQRDNTVHVYDTRKFTSNSNTSSGSGVATSSISSVKPIRSFRLEPHTVYDATFLPWGQYLVLATKSGTDGMGELRIFPWDSSNLVDANGSSTSASDRNQDTFLESHTTFVGHTSAITTVQFSPDKTKLATGGLDSLVALWDAANMVCTSTNTRRSKSIRSLAFSFDSRILANCCYDEEGVDLNDALTGEYIGTVSLTRHLQQSQHSQQQQQSALGSGPPLLTGISGNTGKFGMYGSEDIAFHPKAYIIACANGDIGSTKIPPVTIAKFNTV